MENMQELEENSKSRGAVWMHSMESLAGQVQSMCRGGNSLAEAPGPWGRGEQLQPGAMLPCL